jgi:hypothetical protein
LHKAAGVSPVKTEGKQNDALSNFCNRPTENLIASGTKKLFQAAVWES